MYYFCGADQCAVLCDDRGKLGDLANSSSEAAVQIRSMCNETKDNIGQVQKCIDQVILFLKNDVQKGFTAYPNHCPSQFLPVPYRYPPANFMFLIPILFLFQNSHITV